ncbi:MAG: alpha-L-fucosidase, partial [Verrucomicrobia bacterium]|nr:alpha-L-fucosidase [Verrucomicrobiota bacterium]
MKKTLLTLAALSSLALQPLTSFAEEKPAAPTPAATPNPDPYAKETKAERDARMAWWRDARFGLFIHWGVYAVPEGIHNGKPVDGYGEWI